MKASLTIPDMEELLLVVFRRVGMAAVLSKAGLLEMRAETFVGGVTFGVGFTVTPMAQWARIK